VSCFSTFTVKWLIPRLFDFHAQHPEIEVRLQATGQAAAPQQVRVDVAIAVEALAQVIEDTTTVLFPERLGVVLAPALAQSAVLQSPSDLSGHTLLQTHTRQNAWAMWADAMDCTAATQTGPTFEHYYFTLQAAIGGLGLAVAPGIWLRMTFKQDACHKRARPVVMTTLAMGAGMVPLAIGWGAADPSFRSPMAVAVIGGLITSTVLSLLVIPAVFTLVDDIEVGLGKLLHRLRRGKAQPAQASSEP